MNGFMDIETLKNFFFWCLIINSGIYLFTALAVIIFRDFTYSIQRKIFKIDDTAVGNSIQRYLGTYKLLITFFNFTPWLVLLIMQ